MEHTDPSSAITVRGLKISYRTVRSFSFKTIFSKKHNMNRYEALHGVDFDVRRGEILGVIGENGSGKSTLLRALAGIFSPDEGYVNTHGANVSLLAIGVGFQKELTGRENIMLSGLLLGFDKKTIREKTDEIIEFSSLQRVIDSPVSTYSSGMYSKLAFSITAVLEPDILLIDEVLSVGDRRFRKKSARRMRELISNADRTVVLVSHNLESIRRLCSRVLWLDAGEVRMIGDTDAVLAAYEEYMD
ncbi:MAG: ABC transporter ATP-binding protein [Oscillospiraceae bacterium]|nr:ABC transporter ATP-binding protein [Oscillospiraceae bacterium]